MKLLVCLLIIVSVVLAPASAGAFADLTRAVVVSPASLSGPEKKAVVMLREEVEKRTQILWQTAQGWPADDVPVIAVGPASSLNAFAGKWASRLAADRGVAGAEEGYRIRVVKDRAAPTVFVVGNDARGVLFGLGHLLRSLHICDSDSSEYPDCGRGPKGRQEIGPAVRPG